jgi:hypothetical protein
MSKKAVIRLSPQKINSTGLSKNAKLDAEFKSIEEVAKKSYKKLSAKWWKIGSFPFCYCLPTFLAFNFFGDIFATSQRT